MAETDQDTEGTENTENAAPKKKGRMGLLIGLVLALVLGGGGFYAVMSGMILAGGGGESAHADAGQEALTPLQEVGFVPLEPLVISIGTPASRRHLQFRAELEVVPGNEEQVSKLIPRVMDVLNSYLRAVAPDDLEDPSALITLRAQMLRRIQLVTGESRVRDLLIMEFVLN
jgi:flagellar protein FliL